MFPYVDAAYKYINKHSKAVIAISEPFGVSWLMHLLNKNQKKFLVYGRQNNSCRSDIQVSDACLEDTNIKKYCDSIRDDNYKMDGRFIVESQIVYMYNKFKVDYLIFASKFKEGVSIHKTDHMGIFADYPNQKVLAQMIGRINRMCTHPNTQKSITYYSTSSAPFDGLRNEMKLLKKLTPKMDSNTHAGEIQAWKRKLLCTPNGEDAIYHFSS